MENFCWEWDVLKRLTAHVDSGEPLPRALFERMLAAKNFQSGLQTLRQVEFALFDMRLHAEPGSETHIQQVLDEVRREVQVVVPPPFAPCVSRFCSACLMSSRALEYVSTSVGRCFSASR